MENKIILLWLVVPPIIAKILLNQFIKISYKKSWLKKNYRGNLIPCSLGIIFAINLFVFYTFFGIILLSGIGEFHFSPWQGISLVIFSVLVLTIGIAGFWDDLHGNQNIKGFKGHISTLFREKEITSGLVKLIIGAVASMVCGYLIESSIFMYGSYNFNFSFKMLFFVLLDALVISLFINFFNLLDLRPLRLTKGFFVILFFLIFILDVFTKNISLLFLQWIHVYLMPLILSLIVYLPVEIKENGMMGDSGSNLIGFIVGSGVVFVVSLFSYPVNLYLKLALLFFLISFHIWCEFYSLSYLIEKNKILKFLDKLWTNQ